MTFDLERFVEAQRDCYDQALREIARGRKQSHWIWFVFQFQAGEVIVHSVGIPDGQAVGFFRVAGDLGQVPVGGKSDRAGHRRPDIVADRLLDPFGEA